MPYSRISGSLSSPNFDVVIDMGNPFLNRTVDGFLKIGTVSASRVAAEETYNCLRKGRVFFMTGLCEIGSVSSHMMKETLKKMCKEGIYWGSIAGVYVGMEYGMERIRGSRDWVYVSVMKSMFSQNKKNALLGGAITGALVSVANKNSGDKVVTEAIKGGAVATAVEFLNYLT
ncbi:hypothetical protein QJS10_CPA03g01618 [Acorus calamus]|uniref:Outer envelope pore protein 16, chloroplastic n=1 Tax=Acorus calamus TaxID=4465 RepID=A0AAV9F4F5_ACOCL|nr:hypothetical protein QJS10_CPA03g01618 [Acorus calamus]